MSPDDLEKLVLETKNPREIVAAFKGMPETERRKLSTTARKLQSQLDKDKPAKDASERVRRYLKYRTKEHWNLWNKSANQNATLLMFAVCPISSLKRRSLYVSDRDLLTAIFLDRNPEWLSEWVAYEWEQEWSLLHDFELTRKWVKMGLCERPDVERYYFMFAHQTLRLQDAKSGPIVSVSDHLLANKDLLADVWKLFEYDTNAFDANPWFQHKNKIYELWPEALKKLSDAGHLDRERLLDTSLEACWRDLNANNLGGMARVHKAMEPTSKERFERQSEYLTLMSHTVGTIAKFGLEMASDLEKDKALDEEKFFTEVQPVFFQELKGNAVYALKLIKRILKNQKKVSGTALNATLEAFRHPNADVQSLAVDILEPYQASFTEDMREEIGQAAEFAPASIKSRLLKLVGESGVVSEIALIDKSEMQGALNDLSKSGNTALRIDELSDPENRPYVPISPNIMDHKVLTHLAPITPIETEGELLTAIGHMIEVVDSPDEIERIFDAISRLCGSKSKDFKSKADPLLHRMEATGIGSWITPTSKVGTTIVLRDFLSAYLTGRKPSRYRFARAQLTPVLHNMVIAGARVAKETARPLLWTATHTGGWIDPEVWIKRLNAFQSQNTPIEAIELSLSMLRLAPDNRDTALAKTSQLEGNIKRIAQFVLGGDVEVLKSDIKSYDVWISAARARDPLADWKKTFAGWRLQDDLPDALCPVMYEWNAFVKEETRYQTKYKYEKLDITSSIGGENTPAPNNNVLAAFNKYLLPKVTDWSLLPSTALTRLRKPRNKWSSYMFDTGESKWLSYQWPLACHSAQMTGVYQTVMRINDDASTWTPNHGFYDNLFQKGRPWGEPAHLLLFIGLVSKDADVRGIAVDAMIEGIEGGRFDPSRYADVLCRLTHDSWAKLNRLNDSLLQVVSVSPLHAWVLSVLLQNFVANVDLKQRNMFSVLAVLLEAQSTIGQPLNKPAKDALGTIKGSSKAAKTARSLIGMDISYPDMPKHVRQLAILGRVS